MLMATRGYFSSHINLNNGSLRAFLEHGLTTPPPERKRKHSPLLKHCQSQAGQVNFKRVEEWMYGVGLLIMILITAEISLRFNFYSLGKFCGLFKNISAFFTGQSCVQERL